MRPNISGRLSDSFSEKKFLARAFECLFEHSREAFFMLDTRGKIIAINRRAEQLAKIGRGKIIGKAFREVVPTEILPKTTKAFQQLVRGKRVKLELKFKTLSNDNVIVEVISMPCIKRGKAIGVLGIVRDVTGERRTERTLQENEQLFRNIVENSPEAIYCISENGTLVSLNSTFEKMTGWRCSDWLGKSFVPLIHPDDLPLANETFQKTLCGETVPLYELRIRSKSGNYIIGKFTSSPYVRKGRIAGEFGIVRDVTEQKKAEETLRTSEMEFRMLFEKVPVGIYRSSSEGKILTANPALVYLLGYDSLEELLSINVKRDLYAKPTDRAKWQRQLEEKGEIQNAELVLRRKNGQKLTILENSYIVRDEQGKILYYEGTLVDITDRKSLEEKLSTLNFFSEKLSKACDHQQIYEFTLDALEETLGFENAAFMIIEKGSLKIGAQRGYKELSLELPLDGSKRGITVRAANTRKPMLVPDVKKDKDYVSGAPSVRSEVAVPVVIENRILGILDAESDRIGAFDERDVALLQILGSHAATAIRNLERRQEIEQRSDQMAVLMSCSADMIRPMNLRRRLRKIAEIIAKLGWRRVVIRAIRGGDLHITSPEDLVTFGLSREEKAFLWNNRTSGKVWQERFGPEYERFKLGEFYHLPWDDPWVRKKFSKSTVPSKLVKEEMVDWNPQDLLYAPLHLPNGRVVGLLSIDDPLDGKKPIKESLAPLELFIHQAAIAIENAQLIEQLNAANDKIREYADQLEEKVKQRTKDLRENEEKLSSIFASSPNAITVTNLKGDIIECNQATLNLHGYLSKNDLIGKNAFEFIAKKDRIKAMENLGKTLHCGSIRNVEYTLLAKDEHEFPAELSAGILRDSSGKPKGFVGITNDITARKKTEKALQDSQQKLLKSERLAAIGEVAAMVGHDLRNPLTGIVGAAYYLKMKLGAKIDEKSREMLEIIEKDVEYADKIVNDLLDYSREIPLELKETTPKSIVKAALSFVDVPKNVQLLDLTRNKPKMNLDTGKMTRVFVNLIKNAIDAMPKGGKLAINSNRTKNGVEIVVIDTGTGMSKQVKQRLWSPLFTTKARGMGFGLPICKRVIEAHGGKISAESAVGKGTIFTVIIPVKPKSEGGEQIWLNVPESSLSTMTKT